MDHRFSMEASEKHYLREVARKYREYAHLPVMQERTELWYAHNSLHGNRPPVVMELETFENDILPPLKCTSPAAREIEYNLIKPIVNHDLIDDDKVIAPYYSVAWKIQLKPFDLEIKTVHAEDGHGRMIGYAREHPIRDLKEDIHLVKPSVYSVDREHTLAWKACVESVIGDILPVRIKNNSLRWYAALTARVVELMGMENMLFALMDYPDEMHRLLAFIKDDILAFARWQEKEGLLTPNTGNDYAGAGSYGFSNELPESGDRTTMKDLWLNTNSQETVGISPRMFADFAFPYYQDLAKEFGLVYYGCCEPVHGLWEETISRLPGLRKVSVSPWCDEALMGEALRGGEVIYSRKPSPLWVGLGDFDEEGFRTHITQTLTAARGCPLEFIFRDVYALDGDRTKPGKAVAITRELIDRTWEPA